MTPWTIFGPPVHGRACGHCKFCCVVVPVEMPLNKPAGVKCQHLRASGCSIYAARPDVCRYWSCAWLYQPDASILRRPDISGYAVDCMPQEILINHEPVRVIQVWVDPHRKDAHRAPELRAFLDKAGRDHRMPAIVRWPNGEAQEGQDAMVLFPPSLTDDGEWWEKTSEMISTDELKAKIAKHRQGGSSGT
jgi:hypothetical protein